MSSNSIVFRGVSKFYGEVLGVNQVDLSIPPGITSLVGPNGSGKTTMMNLVTGLMRPTQGSISVLGASPDQPDRLRDEGRVRRLRIGGQPPDREGREPQQHHDHDEGDAELHSRVHRFPSRAGRSGTMRPRSVPAAFSSGARAASGAGARSPE